MINKQKWAKDLNKHLNRENTIGKQECEDIPNIKTTMWYHYTPFSKAKIKKKKKKKGKPKTDIINCQWGWRRKRTLLHCWWEYKMVLQLWKRVWQFLTKLKMVLPYDPVLCCYLFANWFESYVYTKPALEILYNFIYNCQNLLDETKISFNRWMYNQSVMHPCNGILFRD